MISNENVSSCYRHSFLSPSSCAADGFLLSCWAWLMAGMLGGRVLAKCHINSDAFVLALTISHSRPHTEL